MEKALAKNPLSVYPGRWKKADREAVQKIYKDETAPLEDRKEAAEMLAYDCYKTIYRKLRSISGISLLDSLINYMKENGGTDSITTAELIGYMDEDEIDLLYSELKQAQGAIDWLKYELRKRYKNSGADKIVDMEREVYKREKRKGNK